MFVMTAVWLSFLDPDLKGPLANELLQSCVFGHGEKLLCTINDACKFGSVPGDILAYETVRTLSCSSAGAWRATSPSGASKDGAVEQSFEVDNLLLKVASAEWRISSRRQG